VSPRAGVSWWLAALGAAVAVVLFVAAEPGSVLALASRARVPHLLAALLLTVALVVIRGLRLSLLAGRQLPPLRGAAVAAAAQVAAGVLPLRLGELALIPLLRAAGFPGAVRGLSILVFVRVFDLTALLVWAVAATALVGGSPAAALAGLAILAVASPLAAALGLRWLRRSARGWRRRPGWRRRVLMQLLRVRRELVLVARSPLRAGGCAALSLLLWPAIFGVTVALLRGMGLDWPPGPVFLGVVGASLGAMLPVNSVGNFGTQEAGWAAALSVVGVPARQALASGFACHLWALLLLVPVGAAGVAYLIGTQPGRSASVFLASLKRAWRSGRDA
jgi:hypothetical protein